MIDEPVINESGHTFEKKALLEYMKNNGKSDPITGKRINNSNLI